MSDGANIQDWLDAVIEASDELASVALGLDNTELIGIKEAPPENDGSAYIALVGEKTSIQLGILSNKEGCQLMARTLLAMEPEEEDLEESEVADAVSEIANILAGQVKTIMAQKDASVNLGIPIFVHGGIEVTEAMNIAAADMKLGSIPVTFLVLKTDSGASA